MEQEIIKGIENTLTQLDKSTTWIFITLMVVLFSSFQETDEFEIGKFKIKKANSSLIFYIILCALNFQILKYLQNLSSLIESIEITEVLKLKIQTHTWIFNPFASSNGTLSYLLDYIGLPMLIIMWWIGFTLANKESVQTVNKSARRLIIFLFFTYLVFGLLSLILIQSILASFDNFGIKLLTELVGVLFGLIFFVYYSKKHDVIKKLFS